MKAWLTVDGSDKPIVIDYNDKIHLDFNPVDPHRRKKPTDWVHPEGLVEIEWDYAGYCVGVNVTHEPLVKPQ